MKEQPQSSVRLYVIKARGASAAVVFRRGPSKNVQLIKWDTNTDQFEEGQWLKGRIYERRCDLSPDGSLLIYFAANYKEPYFSWTAISKPPFLTALAFWPKGDGWGGGGLFEAKTTILLNHRAAEMDLADGSALPSHVKVRPFGDRPGWGEDHPIWGERLMRDGWRLVQEAKHVNHKLGAKVGIELDPAEVWEREDPHSNFVLRMMISGLAERDGAWYVVDHEVIDKKSRETISLGGADWADWASNGDLLFAKDGSLFRLKTDTDRRLKSLSDAALLINLSENQFEAREAPVEAKIW